jgi:hypothetical protein
MKIMQKLIAWFAPRRGYSDRWLQRETARLLARASEMDRRSGMRVAKAR